MTGLSTLWALWAGGCVVRGPIDVLAARPSEVELGPFEAPRPCALTVAPVEDRRPASERFTPDDGVKFKYFVPGILWFQWETAGPRYGDPERYAADLGANVRELLDGVVRDARLCDPAAGGPALTVVPVLEHYYGVGYEKSASVFTYGAGSTTAFTFFPAGQVSLALSLVDAGGATVATSRIDQRYLYAPDDPAMRPVDPTVAGIREAALLAPREALRRALLDVPLAVDRMLATAVPAAALPSQWAPIAVPGAPVVALPPGAPLAVPADGAPAVVAPIPNAAVTSAPAPSWGGPTLEPSAEPAPPVSVVAPSAFLALRLTREYEFEEEVWIETATARIVQDRVVRRRIPVISAPDEWVVAPVDPSGRWMAPDAYAALVEALSAAGYDVAFGSNLTAARFRGLRAGGPVP